MLSKEKVEANQANAQKSTGPRTEQGKYTSSRNNTRHGLRSNTRFLPGENPADFDILSQGMLSEFNPLDVTETELVNQLIDIQWRLRRAGDYEAKVLTQEPPDFKGLNAMSLHAARLTRQYSATLKQFEARHAVNTPKHRREFYLAEKVHQADKILNRPSTLQELGFEWTAEYFERRDLRKEAIEYAEEVLEEFEEQEDTEDFAQFDRANRGKSGNESEKTGKAA
jgi:hypothetical protein